MNLHQLRYFQTVARLQHFTKAAHEHMTSQPALSAAINNLEKELGVQLFEKLGRGVMLTSYGEIFLKHVDIALCELDKGIEEINLNIKMNSNSIKLSTTFRLGASILPEILIAFNKANPKYTIKIAQGPNHKLIELLESGKTDFLLGRLEDRITENSYLDYRVLFLEDIYLLASVKNPISQKEEVSLSELRDQNIIIFDETTGFKKATLDFFNELDFEPKISYEATENSTVASLVEANLGVAFVGEMKGINNKMKILKIKSPECKSQICVAWNKELLCCKPVKVFIDFITSHYREPVHREWINSDY